MGQNHYLNSECQTNNKQNTQIWGWNDLNHVEAIPNMDFEALNVLCKVARIESSWFMKQNSKLDTPK